MTQLNFAHDAQGFNTYAPRFPSDIFTATLSNGSAQSVTTPSYALTFIMTVSATPGGSVWVSNGGTANNPVGGTFAAAVSELNPGPRLVDKGAVISLLTTNATTDVEVAFYANS